MSAAIETVEDVVEVSEFPECPIFVEVLASFDGRDPRDPVGWTEVRMPQGWEPSEAERAHYRKVFKDDHIDLSDPFKAGWPSVQALLEAAEFEGDLVVEAVQKLVEPTPAVSWPVAEQPEEESSVDE